MSYCEIFRTIKVVLSRQPAFLRSRTSHISQFKMANNNHLSQVGRLNTCSGDGAYDSEPGVPAGWHWSRHQGNATTQMTQPTSAIEVRMRLSCLLPDKRCPWQGIDGCAQLIRTADSEVIKSGCEFGRTQIEFGDCSPANTKIMLPAISSDASQARGNSKSQRRKHTCRH